MKFQVKETASVEIEFDLNAPIYMHWFDQFLRYQQNGDKVEVISVQFRNAYDGLELSRETRDLLPHEIEALLGKTPYAKRIIGEEFQEKLSEGIKLLRR